MGIKKNELICKNLDISLTINNLLLKSSTVRKSCFIKLNTCSPEVDLINLGPGGICVDCSTFFKVKISLSEHLKKCSNKEI